MVKYRRNPTFTSKNKISRPLKLKDTTELIMNQSKMQFQLQTYNQDHDHYTPRDSHPIPSHQLPVSQNSQHQPQIRYYEQYTTHNDSPHNDLPVQYPSQSAKYYTNYATTTTGSDSTNSGSTYLPSSVSYTHLTLPTIYSV